MRHLLHLVLYILLLSILSCMQYFPFMRTQSTSPPEDPAQLNQLVTIEAESSRQTGLTNVTPPPPGADSTSQLAANTDNNAFPARDPALEVVEIPVDPDEPASVEKPETDQKRIDDALDLYQEGLGHWSSGDPEKAIESFDQSYQIICSIPTKESPEIIQQKEDLRLLISKRILEIYAARSTLHRDLSREIPLAMNEHVAREIKRFQNSERQFFTEA